MNSDIKEPKDKKFYFTANIFDEDHVEVEEHEEDALPVLYSEDEFEAAQRKAFADGKAEGVKQTQDTQQQRIAMTLDMIAQNISGLAIEEERRAEIFEAEAVALTLSVFEKAFPILDKEHGFDEFKAKLADVLKLVQNQNDITIKINTDSADDVQNLLNDLTTKGLNAHFTIMPDSGIEENTCRLSWADGGAIVDRNRLTQEIHDILQETLAAGAAYTHDDTIEKSGEQTQPNATSEQVAPDLQVDNQDLPDDHEKETEQP